MRILDAARNSAVHVASNFRTFADELIEMERISGRWLERRS
jgi:hypothetical protein